LLGESIMSAIQQEAELHLHVTPNALDLLVHVISNLCLTHYSTPAPGLIHQRSSKNTPKNPKNATAADALIHSASEMLSPE